MAPRRLSHSLVIPLLVLSPFSLSPSSAFPISLPSTPAILPKPAEDALNKLSFVRRVNSTGSANVLRFDQARAKALRERAQTSPTDSQGPGSQTTMFDVEGESQAVSYVVSALIGTPPQAYQLLVDTGSSNTWVGAGKLWTPSFSTRETGELVSVTYGSGYFTGFEVIEKITLAEGLTIGNQSIGVAVKSKGFQGVDGILGIGPQDLTCGSFLLNENTCVPTVIDNAWNQGLLDNYAVGISFNPSTTADNKNGELTFGGADETKFIGDLQYVPLTTKAPAKLFVGIDQTILYGEDAVILRETAGIVDTGTTLILIASDAFEKYATLTGGKLDRDTGLLRITPDQYKNLRSLFFRIHGVDYEIIPNAQIWPRALNEMIGGDADGIYLIVNDVGSPSGNGLDFINGMSFLERVYAVYDVGNNRAGFAKTQHTYVEVN